MNISSNLKNFLSNHEDLINEGDIEALYGEAAYNNRVGYSNKRLNVKDFLDLNELIIKSGIGKVPEAFLLLQEVINKEGTLHNLKNFNKWDKYNGYKCKIIDSEYLEYYDNKLSKKENFNNLDWTVLVIDKNNGNFELYGISGNQIQLDEPLED